MLSIWTRRRILLSGEGFNTMQPDPMLLGFSTPVDIALGQAPLSKTILKKEISLTLENFPKFKVSKPHIGLHFRTSQKLCCFQTLL